MNLSNLRIPFALRAADQTLVGPEEVARGAACGCICPSCGLPLVANQGEYKVWHFSHNTRGRDKEVAEQCDYSFYVSVAAMAKQLLGDGLTLSLPAYRVAVEYPPKIIGALQSMVNVTDARTFTPTRAEIDVEVNGTKCDVVLWHKEHQLAIFLTHKERRAPQMHDASLRGEKIGVVEINLTGMGMRYGELRAGEAFKAAVAQFLQADLDSKHWIHHPRADRKIQQCQEGLKSTWDGRISRGQSHWRSNAGPSPARFPSLASPAAVQPSRKVHYQCRLCGRHYDGVLPGIVNCPSCSSPANLFSVEIKRDD